jgi:hypothetical protein
MNKSEIKKVLALHQKWLNGEKIGKQADLSGANLSGADLSGANLRSADLSGADLRSADLSGANLSYANLRSANLSGANLRSANLRSANLSGADLSGANLSGADLRSANLSGATLRSADLDFSCWPLWCGSLGVKTNLRIPAQLAYHLCRLDCDDKEVKKAQKALAKLASKFHRFDECGGLPK